MLPFCMFTPAFWTQQTSDADARRIDDIQDSSDLRRGSPAAHRIFGTAQSINSANYMYFLAQQELLKLQKPVAMQIYVEELLNLHRGQGIELFWRDTLTVPTEEEYLLMVSNKTGGLFRLAARLMQAVSTTTYNILPVAELVGLMFQVRDDHRSLSCEQVRDLLRKVQIHSWNFSSL